jgi:crossover junction endodeoxyribonuclease RuvC
LEQYQSGGWGSASARGGLSSKGVTRRILGIDPGSRYTGYGVILSAGGKHSLVAAGRIDTCKGTAGEKLCRIYQGLKAVIAEYTPDECALEETFVNRANPQSALVLGQARGVALLAAAETGYAVAEYATATVKLAVAGHGRADKLAIARMVGLLLQTKQLLAPDATDALAVAICHAHSH